MIFYHYSLAGTLFLYNYTCPFAAPLLNCLYVTAITSAETSAVRMSDTGMEYRTPSKPKNVGRRSANPTPSTISRTIDRIVDAIALPIACRKMKVALLTQVKTIMHRYIRKARMAKSV